MPIIMDKSIDGSHHVVVELTINGEGVIVYPKTHPHIVNKSDYDIILDLCDGYVFRIYGDDRYKRYRIAGFDTNKIDMAYPQDILEDETVLNRIRAGDRLCWSYEGDIWGHAQWDSDMIPRLQGAVLFALLDEMMVFTRDHAEFR